MSKNRKKLQAIDTCKVLSKSIPVKSGDKTVQLSPDELGVRHLTNRGIKGDMNAAKRIITQCLDFDLLDQKLQTPYCPTCLIIPDGWDMEEWHAMFKKHGMPPWPGPDDGFSDECRIEYRYWRKFGHHSWIDGQ